MELNTKIEGLYSRDYISAYIRGLSENNTGYGNAQRGDLRNINRLLQVSHGMAGFGLMFLKNAKKRFMFLDGAST